MAHQQHILPSYWAMAYLDSVDAHNCSPTPHNPPSSPYQLYDKSQPDAMHTPFLPWGTIVVGHIPVALQTAQSGRGCQYIYVGRCPDNCSAIQLFNPRTKRIIIRRSFKIVGSHSTQHMLFSDPLHLMLFTGDELLEPPSVTDLLPPVADLPPSVPTHLPYPPDTAGPLLHYRSVDIRDVHPSQKRFFNNNWSSIL
jgi:hypothetical protein